MWPTSPTPLSFKPRLYLAAGKMGLSRKTSSFIRRWDGSRLHSISSVWRCLQKTEKLRSWERTWFLSLLQLYSEKGSHVTSASVSSYERESELPGQGAEIPGPPRWRQRESAWGWIPCLGEPVQMWAQLLWASPSPINKASLLAPLP